MFYPIEKAKGLNDLKDTSIVAPINDDAPVYNSTTQEWENKQITTKEQWKKNGAYNICPNPMTTHTTDGITYTVRSDGSVEVSGTASQNTIAYLFNKDGYLIPDNDELALVGCPAGGGENTYQVLAKYKKKGVEGNQFARCYGANAKLTKIESITAVAIAIQSGVTITTPIIFKPMLTTDLNATYDDYVPYAPTNRDLAYVLPTIKNNGAYNLYKIGVASQSYSGVTFSISKGVVTVNTNGTLESEVNFELNLSGDRKPLSAGTYKLVGCPLVKGQDGKWRLKYIYDVSGSYTAAQDLGDGVIFTLTGSETTAWMRITLSAGASGTFVFYPMITTDLNATYNDYVEYAKTNGELTADIDDLELTTISYNLQSTGLTATTNTGQITALGMNIMFDKKGIIHRMSGRVVLSGTEANVRPNIEIKHSTFASMKGYWSISGPSLRGSGSTYVACDGCDIQHNNGSNVISISQNNTLLSGPAGYFMIYFNS